MACCIVLREQGSAERGEQCRVRVYREQAQLLMSSALAASDPDLATQFTAKAIELLQRAMTAEGSRGIDLDQAAESHRSPKLKLLSERKVRFTRPSTKSAVVMAPWSPITRGATARRWTGYYVRSRRAASG